MRIGVNLLNFGSWAPQPELLLRGARIAEELGYHLVMVSDHVAVTADVAQVYPAPFYDPFVTLSWLAGQLHRVEIGTTVTILPYRHPLLTARMAANLDQFSGGRLVFGVGSGWAAQEFEALGVPRGRRGALTDEYLAAIKVLWTNDVASFVGPTVRFVDVDTRPRPLQKPHPPIWVGGSSDAALRRAVRFGDAWHPVRPRLSWLREEGLPRLAAMASSEGVAVPGFAPRIKVALTDGPWPGDPTKRLAGQGSVREVRADFAALEDLGATYVVVDTYGDDATAPADHHAQWRTLAVVAEQIVDFSSGTVR